MVNANRDFTERETALIDLLTERFADHSLEALIVNVRAQEGGERPTLRLTLDSISSTDFARSRIAAGEPVEALVEEAAAELAAPGARIGP
jgi:hypothetical protein